MAKLLKIEENNIALKYITALKKCNPYARAKCPELFSRAIQSMKSKSQGVAIGAGLQIWVLMS